jgi:PAS domain S-box-containing protein
MPISMRFRRRPVVLLAGLLTIAALPGFFAWMSNLPAEGLAPQALCCQKQPVLMWMSAGSDAIIGLSYLFISMALALLGRRARKEIPFVGVVHCLALFISISGLAHLATAWTHWVPRYWLSGGLKFLAAAAALSFAISFPSLIPRIVALFKDLRLSSERKIHLEKVNAELLQLNQRLKDVNELKMQFFTNVSHDLRTPLSLILGPAQRLRAMASLPDEQRRMVEMIDRNARLLLRHVNTLLDLSELEAGKMSLCSAQADLVPLVQQVASHFDSLAIERQVNMQLQLPPELRAEVDAEKLQRALFNLLANAFKFTPPGGRICCRLAVVKRRIVLEVCDSGPGVAPHLRQSIFNRYFRAGSARPVAKAGNGLGLAIVKEFIELHGGTVCVDQASLGGARFRAEIPLNEPGSDDAVRLQDVLAPAVPQAPSTPVPTEPALMESAPLTFAPVAERILIVDDEADMRQFLAETLSESYHVSVAENGEAGLAQAIAQKPDLIVSDILMPGMSGEDLLAALRQHPQLKTIPVLLLTASTDEELGARLLQEGAQEYLHKPFQAAELRVRIRHLLSIQRVRDALQKELRSHDEDVSQLTHQLIANRQVLQNSVDQLQASEARFAGILEIAEDAVITVDAERRIMFFNRSAEKIFGYAAHEVMGRPQDLLLSARGAGVHGQYFDAFARTPAVARRMGERGEIFGRRKDGSVFPAEVSISKLDLGSGPVFTAFLRDVSELKRIEDARLASERRWRAIYESSAVGIGLADLTGHILAANPACQRMLGYSEEELKGLTSDDFTLEEDREVANLRISDLISGRVPEYHVQRRVLRKDGSQLWVNASLSLVPGSAEAPPMLVGVLEDISERKQAEEALDQAQMALTRMTRITMMGELAASIAHEVNQPLAAIVMNGGACQRWLNANPPNMEEARNAASRIVRDANRASEVISTIRSFVKRGVPRREQVDINKLVRETVELLRDQARSHKVGWDIVLAADLPSVVADRIQVQQVLLNLMMNAIEAMGSVAGRRCVVRVHTRRDGTDAVKVTVSDCGPGLDPGDRESVFSAFSTTKEDGMGMGLAIGRSIVEAHGGHLWAVPNEDGPGETFQFTVPISGEDAL